VLPSTLTEAPESSVVGVNTTDAALFTTDNVYEVVPGLNTGDRVPVLTETRFSESTRPSGAPRDTVRVYVFVVVVSPAVTTTLITLTPVRPSVRTVRACAVDWLPDVTLVPATVRVAADLVVVGVNLMEGMAFGTFNVYATVAEENVGDKERS
jgi:hypothetical protein